MSHKKTKGQYFVDCEKKEKESGKGPHQRVRKKVRAKRKKLRKCLLNHHNQNKKSGSSQLKGGVSTMRGNEN